MNIVKKDHKVKVFRRGFNVFKLYFEFNFILDRNNHSKKFMLVVKKEFYKGNDEFVKRVGLCLEHLSTNERNRIATYSRRQILKKATDGR